MSNIKTCYFEVHGKVQKVFFRKYTQKQAIILGITGWIMNTPSQTVKGVIEGPEKSFTEMQNWLRTTGSPKSQITKANFTNEQNINKKNFQEFVIKN